MSLESKVVWSEGMFLRSQHFQQNDRYLERLVRARTAGIRPHAWGLAELRLNEALLKTGKFAVLACRGIFDDGTPFAIPDDTDPPPPGSHVTYRHSGFTGSGIPRFPRFLRLRHEPPPPDPE